MAVVKSLPEMDSKEFLRWRDLLEKRTGVWLSENRKSFLMTSLAQRMREHGYTDYDSYYKSLESGVGSAIEWVSLVDLLTVHETRFFRDQASAELVQSHIQNLVSQKKSNVHDTNPLNIQLLSAGCSTGEEVYSLAFLMNELDPRPLNDKSRSFYYGVTGIDISFPSLAQAREGIYHKNKLKEIPENWLRKYFEKLPDDYFQINNTIRHRTCFIQSNLLELDAMPNQSFDIIYCQNVLIYFQGERREEIVRQFFKRLSPGGLLVLGAGELNNISFPSIEKVATKHCQAYTKIDEN